MCPFSTCPGFPLLFSQGHISQNAFLIMGKVKAFTKIHKIFHTLAAFIIFVLSLPIHCTVYSLHSDHAKFPTIPQMAVIAYIMVHDSSLPFLPQRDYSTFLFSYDLQYS